MYLKKIVRGERTLDSQGEGVSPYSPLLIKEKIK
tara:strand:- start:92 stop:193 length:102 start_codon:yes stop_codon:yes gene_type:complete